MNLFRTITGFKAMSVLTFACIALAGCGGISNIEALGDLSNIGDCDLPDGYSAYLLSDIVTNSTSRECPLEGEYVIVRAVPQTSASCTMMICEEPGDRCCNGCDSAGFFLPRTSGSLQIGLVGTDEYPVDYDVSGATSGGAPCGESCDGLECEKEQLIWGRYHCIKHTIDEHLFYYPEIQVMGACSL
ncbi:MAG TPA: hypothetical protein PLY68_00855 [Myxococcota bacterium]|nr:hypothetical protein [Myxococcota bacterium]HNZ03427.1 hypothetical protein [Myxococcota bacterium]HOD07615.1 hypothetical protein [Myxococcota bacterium]HPB49727.1 hypothetical protein [Myxococcota bacterium]HQP94727.1 hypothetical protein [Myxococcota bacterium]